MRAAGSSQLAQDALARSTEAAFAAAAPPLALVSLAAAALCRLDAWALAYVLAAGWLRFGAARLRSWRVTAWLVATAISLQYASALSLPPSVWPPPRRRPWADFGSGWLHWATDDGAECERLAGEARIGHAGGGHPVAEPAPTTPR